MNGARRLAIMGAQRLKGVRGFSPALVVGVVGALGAACASKTPAPNNLAPIPTCAIKTSIGAAIPASDRTLPANYWFTLLLGGFRSSGDVPRPAKDCAGWQVRWPADACPDELAPAPLEPALLTDKDLVITTLGGAKRLVWALVDRLSNGEAVGPVGLAEFTTDGVMVDAIGVLRAFPQQAELRLEKVGAGSVLVAEGDSCGPKDGAGSSAGGCTRAVRLLPLSGVRFLPTDVMDTAGACLGSTLFASRATGSVGKAGQRKKYETQAALTFGSQGIAVHEELVIQDAPVGSDADDKNAFVRRMKADRMITLRGNQLFSTEPSLLGRWMKQHDGGER